MNEKTEIQKTIGSAGLIGVAAFAGALIGFVLQLIVAYFFGASSQTDAYFMALSTSELLGKLLMGGSIAAVFLPMFVDRIAQHKYSEAWDMGLNLLHIFGSAFLAVVIVLGVFAQPFVQFIAPGFDASTTELTVSLLRLMLPSFLFLFLVDIIVSMLHAFKRFTVPALLRIVAPLISVVTLVFLANRVGIYALAVGTVISSLVQLALVWRALRRQGLRYRFVLDARDPRIATLIALVLPFVLSMLVTQVAGIVYRILVSELSTGSLSALKYAEKITQFLTIMFLGSVTTVIYPLLSEKATRNDKDGLRATISSAIRLTLFVAVPIVCGTMILSRPIIEVVYGRGSFGGEAVALTSVALFFLIIGLATNAVSSVLGHAVLAYKDTRAAVAITIASQIVAFTLFFLLVPPMGHAGLALASSLVPTSSALLYFVYLRRYIPNLGRIFWHPTYAKIVALAAGMSVVTYLVWSATNFNVLQTSLGAPIRLLVVIGLSAMMFLGGAYAWRVEEMREVLGIVRGKIEKWQGSKKVELAASGK